MRKFTPVLAVAGLAATTTVVALAFNAGQASAHTNESYADCAGIHAQAFNYNPAGVNTITVNLDGSVIYTGTFPSSYTNGFGVPQDGNPHTWSVIVDSWENQWDSTVSGGVGPCGETDTTEETTTSTTTTTSTSTLPSSTTSTSTPDSTTSNPTTSSSTLPESSTSSSVETTSTTSPGSSTSTSTSVPPTTSSLPPTSSPSSTQPSTSPGLPETL